MMKKPFSSSWFFGIEYVASQNARALTLQNPLITDWSETSISHGDVGDGRYTGFVRAMSLTPEARLLSTDNRFLNIRSRKRCHPYLLEESFVIFGLVRRSRYEELQKQMDELKAYMKVLTSDVEKLRKEAGGLRNDIRASKQRISQLQA